MRRKMLWGVIALVASAIMSCTEEKPVSTTGWNEDRPFRVTENFEAKETVSGNLAWILKATEARTYERPTRTLMDSVCITFYSEDGTLRSTLWSDSGRAQEEKGVLIAQGNVLLISTQGDTLETEFLRYRQHEDEISGPGPVRLAQKGRVLTGEGFQSAPDLSDYKINRDVKIISRDLPEAIKEDLEEKDTP